MNIVIKLKIFNKLIKNGYCSNDEHHCLLFDNAPSFKRTVYVSNFEDIGTIVDQHYIAFTYDSFYSNPLERLSKAFIKIIDCDCNTLEERIKAINYYSNLELDRKNFICAVYNNSKTTQGKHKYGFHIFYMNNFKNGFFPTKEYIQWKKNQPFDFIDKTYFYSCVKNPFNKNFILKDSLIVEDELL